MMDRVKGYFRRSWFRFLCWIGRHSYEFDFQDCRGVGHLKCLDCGAERHSSNGSVGLGSTVPYCQTAEGDMGFIPPLDVRCPCGLCPGTLHSDGRNTRGNCTFLACDHCGCTYVAEDNKRGIRFGDIPVDER